MSSFQEVDVAGLHKWLAAQTPGVRLIDVRTPAEVARGAIPGAKNIPLHMIPIAADELGTTEPVVFYCQSGARSAQACSFMAARGHKNVYNLRGGIMGWLQQGLPTGATATN